MNKISNYIIPILAFMSLLTTCKVSDNTSMAWAAVSTIAGSSTPGHTDSADTAKLNRPPGVAVDSSGNIYVADNDNHRIRKITPGAVVSTIAGSDTVGRKNGAGAAAKFFFPTGVTVDSYGNIYVADNDNHRIRKITPAGVVSTFAGSSEGYNDATGTAAQFNYPYSVTADSSGNIYVADTGNHRIRKITPVGEVSTIAGSGTIGHKDATGTAAQFNYPYGMTVDSYGNIYVADKDNHRIRKITPAGVVSTIAGTGTPGHTDTTGAAAQFYYPTDVAVDSSGNIYVADTGNHRIRKITPAGTVSTIAGSTPGYNDGAGTAARFMVPKSVAVDSSDNIYVADRGNYRIRKITPGAVVSTIAGTGTWGSKDGAGAAAQFNTPFDVAVDSSGNIYVADTSNHRIRKIEYKLP